MSDRIAKAILQLQRAMDEEKVDPTKGLPQELFIFATTLMPCPNIDLFISRGSQLLLTWRNDEFYGKGWHIPGGCMRLKETLGYRIQETAKKEIGIEVDYDKDHFITRESIAGNRPWMNNQLERCHNISMLFRCELPEGFEILNSVDEGNAGFLRWFDHTPDDLLEAHRLLYGDVIEEFFKGELRWPM